MEFYCYIGDYLHSRGGVVPMDLKKAPQSQNVVDNTAAFANRLHDNRYIFRRGEMTPEEFARWQIEVLGEEKRLTDEEFLWYLENQPQRFRR